MCQVNDSSPKTVLSQLCELLAARPLQGLVYEEERPPRTAWGPLAPMLEFVSAQTGLPIVAVGGGAGLGRMPQVGGRVLALRWERESECVSVYERERERERGEGEREIDGYKRTSVQTCDCFAANVNVWTGEWDNVN